jgi:hypothetical protein
MGGRSIMSKFIGLAAGLTTMLVVSGAALAASATSPGGVVQTLEVSHSSAKPGAGTYLTATMSFGSANGSRGAAVKQVNMHVLKRWGWSWAQFPKCDPAKLATQGPSICPKGSKVGTGSATADARPIVADPVNATVTAYNGKRIDGHRTFLLYIVPEIGSPFLVPGTETRRDFIEFPVPLIPTLPGQANALPTFFTIKAGGKITKTRRVNGSKRGVTINYFSNPRSCNGGWPWQFDFTYENGEQLSATDEAPCKK